MLANGPPWMKAGLFSSVCTRLGASASLSSTVIAPCAFRSLAVTGFCSRVADDDVPQALLQILEGRREAEDRHHFGGDDDVEAVLARVAVAGPPSATTMSRSARSFMSPARASTGCAARRCRSLPVDVVVEHRRQQIVGELIAPKSPVKCRLMSSIGTTCA